jgi:hypothetical protein
MNLYDNNDTQNYCLSAQGILSPTTIYPNRYRVAPFAVVLPRTIRITSRVVTLGRVGSSNPRRVYWMLTPTKFRVLKIPACRALRQSSNDDLHWSFMGNT